MLPFESKISFQVFRTLQLIQNSFIIMSKYISIFYSEKSWESSRKFSHQVIATTLIFTQNRSSIRELSHLLTWASKRNCHVALYFVFHFSNFPSLLIPVFCYARANKERERGDPSLNTGKRIVCFLVEIALFVENVAGSEVFRSFLFKLVNRRKDGFLLRLVDLVDVFRYP